MELDAATVMLQWATGGLAFCWVTTRHRIAGIGYGWLLRAVYLVMALLGVVLGRVLGHEGAGAAGRDVSALALGAAASVALIISITRRTVEMSGRETLRAQRRQTIAAMAGRDRPSDREADAEAEAVAEPVAEPVAVPVAVAEAVPVAVAEAQRRASSVVTGAAGAPASRRGAGAEFAPGLDLVAPILGLVGLAFAAHAVGGPYALALVRLVAGAAFLGAVTDAMLLGHWYLTQPGLPRSLLEEINRWVGYTWPVEIAALLWPTGMLQVFSGEVDDGWSGVLGYTWATCALTTIALVVVVRIALREKYYSAVMSATGLLYLAILTAFGTDLIARAVLSP